MTVGRHAGEGGGVEVGLAGEKAKGEARKVNLADGRVAKRGRGRRVKGGQKPGSRTWR